jgi:hypothetical protein
MESVWPHMMFVYFVQIHDSECYPVSPMDDTFLSSPVIFIVACMTDSSNTSTRVYVYIYIYRMRSRSHHFHQRLVIPCGQYISVSIVLSVTWSWRLHGHSTRPLR